MTMIKPYTLQRNKKGLEMTMNTLIIMILVLVTLLVVLIIFYKFTGQGKNDTQNIMDGITDDCDGDGVKDIIDQCPCSGDQESATCAKDVKKCSCSGK